VNFIIRFIDKYITLDDAKEKEDCLKAIEHADKNSSEE
jgi:hypothetical protein